MIRYNEHHYPPQSRKVLSKVVKVPEDFHRAWHILFDNLYSWETTLCLLHIQELCYSCKSNEIEKYKVDKIQKDILKLNKSVCFARQAIRLNWFYEKHTGKECHELPSPYREAWQEVFDGLSGYKSFLLVKKLQLQFDKNKLKVSDSNIKKLRKKLKEEEVSNVRRKVSSKIIN